MGNTIRNCCCPTEVQSPQVALPSHPPSGQTAPLPVIGNLNNQLYINWIKATRGLRLTVDELRNVCDSEMQAWHGQLVLQCGNTQCSGSCSAIDVTKKLTVPSCPTGVCPTWLAAIQLERTKPNNRLIVHNADINQLPKEYWQVAKLFMNWGQDAASVLSSDTDASGIVNLIQNCKRFVSSTQQKTDAVSITLIRVQTQTSTYTHDLAFYGTIAYSPLNAITLIRDNFSLCSITVHKEFIVK